MKTKGDIFMEYVNEYSLAIAQHAHGCIGEVTLAEHKARAYDHAPNSAFIKEHLFDLDDACLCSAKLYRGEANSVEAIAGLTVSNPETVEHNLRWLNPECVIKNLRKHFMAEVSITAFHCWSNTFPQSEWVSKFQGTA